MSGAGSYGIDHHGHEVITQGFFLGVKTNNQAEYLALAIASMLLHDVIDQDNPQTILFVADSQLLVRQMQGIYKVKNPMIKKIKQLIDRKLLGINCSFKHVLREYNVNADKLANVGVDKKKKLPKNIAHELLQEPLSLRVE